MHTRWPRPGLLQRHSSTAGRFRGRRLWRYRGSEGGAAWGRGRGAQFSGQRRLHEVRGSLQAAQRLVQGAGAQEQSRGRRAGLPRGTPGPGAQLDLTFGHRPGPGRRGTLLQRHLHTLELRWGGRTRPAGSQLQVGGPAGATVGALGLRFGRDGRRGAGRREAAEGLRRELLHLAILCVRTAEQGPGAEDDFHLPRRQHAQLGLGWPRARGRASRETRAGPELLAAILGTDGQARLRALPQHRGHRGPIRPALRVQPNVRGLWRTRSRVVGARRTGGVLAPRGGRGQPPWDPEQGWQGESGQHAEAGRRALSPSRSPLLVPRTPALSPPRPRVPWDHRALKRPRPLPRRRRRQPKRPGPWVLPSQTPSLARPESLGWHSRLW